MRDLDRDALDRYITGGRYSSSNIVVTCSFCKENTQVTCETEYGASTWSPEECSSCGHEFTGGEIYFDDEPPEPEYDPLESGGEREGGENSEGTSG